MHAHNDRDQFSPPRPPARLRAITLAVLVHLVLIGALTWGVNWKNTADQPAVEAELWAAVPTQAAPRAVAPPPPPAPIPEPEPTPVAPPPPPPPAPPPVRVAPPPPPDTHEADIAIEREKKRLEQEKKARAQQLEREKRERDRKEDERRDRLEQEKKERLQKEKEKEKEKAQEQREKQLAEQKKAEQEKLEKQKKLAEDKRKAEEAAKRKAEANDKQLAKQREDNLRRIQGLAGATGAETAKGDAQRSADPSGSYGGKVAAKVKPNIVYPDAISGNPRAEVEVKLSPDGTIVGKRLVQSSGNKAWDDAVLRALDNTETLPRDVDGRVPPSLVIGFRPQD